MFDLPKVTHQQHVGCHCRCLPDRLFVDCSGATQRNVTFQ
jgi:hypothetical protein